MSTPLFNAQAAYAFAVRQASIIEPTVYAIQYPDIQYRGLISIDTTGSEYATSVTYYTSDRFGAADWINGNADDVPRAGTSRAQFETPVHSAGIGYGWGWEEIGRAMLLGINLNSDDAMAARRASEEMLDRVFLLGDTQKNYRGLFNYTGAGGVVPVPAPNGDWGTVDAVGTATADEIVSDMNSAILNIFNGTNTVAIADTLLLPWSKFNVIATRRMRAESDETILDYFRGKNIFTSQTGQPLTIRGMRELDTIGTSGAPRMIAYRNAPEVLKAHVPMPHRFLPMYQSGPLRYDVPGVMRLGGLDIRLPREVAYFDGI